MLCVGNSSKCISLFCIFSVSDSIVGSGRNQTIEQTVYFNNIALHAIAISLSVADNALLHLMANLTGNGMIGAKSRIETINHPLPRSLSKQATDAGNSASVAGRQREKLILLRRVFVLPLRNVKNNLQLY